MASVSSFPPPALDSCGRMRPRVAAGETLLLLPPPSPPRAAIVRAGGRAEAVARAHAAPRRYVKRNRLCEPSPRGRAAGAGRDHARPHPLCAREPGLARGGGAGAGPTHQPWSLRTRSWGLKLGPDERLGPC